MKIQLATDLERDNVFAEIYYEEQQWCEVYIDNDSNENLLHIGPDIGVIMPLDEAINALKVAIARLQPRYPDFIETDEDSQ